MSHGLVPCNSLSANNLCKQFGSRSGPKSRAWSGSKLFDTRWYSWKNFFEKLTLKKKLADDKKHGVLIIRVLTETFGEFLDDVPFRPIWEHICILNKGFFDSLIPCYHNHQFVPHVQAVDVPIHFPIAAKKFPHIWFHCVQIAHDGQAERWSRGYTVGSTDDHMPQQNIQRNNQNSK